jgi:diguanylate cyclase (GGDEF)-like protein
VASGAGAGVRTIADHRTAFERLAPLAGNANDWYIVASDPAAVPSFFGDAGPAPFGLAGAGLAFLLLAGVSVRTSRRALQVAAHTDSLTGLANRRQLMDDLAVAFDQAAKGQRFALALFDLDGFKAYNDTFGHVPGDALLRRLAQKLAHALEGWGDAYRLGGDEFCVLVRLQGSEPERVALLGATALAEEGQGFSITASTGTVLLPDEAANPSDALTAADLRMYVQKDSGRRSPARQAADVLVRVLHERWEPLGPHAIEVADLAEAVALRMDLPEHRIEQLRQAAELHDVGKMAIPDAVLDKTGPLNDDEWQLMREHTLIGERILSSAPALTEVGTIVRATHERIDGGGYPDGLAGEEIPLEARIIAAADAFCVMTTERPYDTVRSTKGAMDELWRCSGTQFDPAVVEALAAVLAEMEQPAEPVVIARRAVG